MDFEYSQGYTTSTTMWQYRKFLLPIALLVASADDRLGGIFDKVFGILFFFIYFNENNDNSFFLYLHSFYITIM